MTCYHPVKAFRHPSQLTKTGKPKVVFLGKHYQETPANVEVMNLPCGQCTGCRMAKSKEWAIRCVHEADQYNNNAFLTLTFNDENLDNELSLNKRDFVNFMKRFRKHFKGKEAVDKYELDAETGEMVHSVHYPIRFFHVGEYGDKYKRPHHHACIFNFDFDDKEELVSADNNNGFALYTSETLDELWAKEIDAMDCRYYNEDTLFQRGSKYYAKLGYCAIGEVNAGTAAYCARYVLKKINGPNAIESYVREHPVTGELCAIEPEYITMSRRPGLGKGWLEKYHTDAYPKDFVTSKGKVFRVPKYYDRIFDDWKPEVMKVLKERRKKYAKEHALSPDRLKQLETCLKARTKKLVRSYEL